MLITSGVLWKRRSGSPAPRAGKGVSVCVLQAEKLTNAAGSFYPNEMVDL